MTTTPARISTDDSRVLALARADWEQLTDAAGGRGPAWDELTGREQNRALSDARRWLEAAVRAGLTTSADAHAAEKPRPGGAWTEADRIVAYRSRGGRLLRCLEHHPGEDSVECGDFIPVAAEDLEDGSLCTYPGCGADVLIPARPDDTTGA